MKSCVAGLVVSLAMAATARAQGGPGGPQGPPPWPENGIARAAKAFYDAVNSKDADAVRRFTVEHLAKRLVEGGGAAAKDREGYAAMMAKMKTQSGGLVPMGFRGDGGDGVLGVMSRAKSVDRLIGVEFFESPEEPGKIRQIDLHPMTPPGPPPSWPQGTLDDAAITQAVQNHLRDVEKAGKFSGVVLVARGDRILVNEGVGMANRAKGIKNTPETRFGTASVGKMFTAVAVAQMVEQGKLRFDEPLIEALPSYPNREAASRITIHHLLTHTSGLGDPFASTRREPGRRYETATENMTLFADDSPTFEPGAKHDYSNGNYNVLAAIVEKASGQDFMNYLRDHIYKPAKMPAADPIAFAKRDRAVGYSHDLGSDPLGMDAPKPTTSADDPGRSDVAAGFGGLELTSGDLFRFFRALKTGVLVKPKTAETLVTGKVDVMPGAPMKYGYGFYDIDVSGSRMRGHSGGGGGIGFGAHAEMLWSQDITLIVLGNCDLEEVRPLTLNLANFLVRQAKP